MKRKIKTYGGYFERFISDLSSKEVEKLDYIIALLETADRIPSKFIRYIRGGICELRITYDGSIYRVFFIFDKCDTVVFFNGFKKKTQKTPSSGIKKALQIKEAYYGNK
ncbi:MAG: type II toxin-antitoxin system RelE/ParE family toxin [Tannerella sp.]|jgi:phage-related protein|nr:type II toxin-antitoxin system RelE/ParE family toxin [Tannerella sp.]